jgi:ubiquinone/menaquinone biosynthesis C-methylase UbiE
MNTPYSSSKEFFEQAYKTGSDIWTNNNYTQEFLHFARMLPHKGMVLDVGSGRGHMSFLLADLGMKVIGLDYIEELTRKNNELVKEQGYAGNVAFKTGDILSLPFQEESFDVVVDVETLQHIHPKDWQTYADEIFKVLKPGGFLLLVELSKKTENFLGFEPIKETTGNFEYEGLLYHFFDRREYEEMFGYGFSIIKSLIHTFPKINNHRYIFTLLQKKK